MKGESNVVLGIVRFHYTDTCLVLGEDYNGLVESAIKKLGFKSKEEYFWSLPSGLDKQSKYIRESIKDWYMLHNGILDENSVLFFMGYTVGVSNIVNVDGEPIFSTGFGSLYRGDLYVYPTTEELKSWECWICPEQACSYPFCGDWGVG